MSDTEATPDSPEPLTVDECVKAIIGHHVRSGGRLPYAALHNLLVSARVAADQYDGSCPEGVVRGRTDRALARLREAVEAVRDEG